MFNSQKHKNWETIANEIVLLVLTADKTSNFATVQMEAALMFLKATEPNCIPESVMERYLEARAKKG